MLYLYSNRIVCVFEEVVQDWIVSALQQILHMWLGIISLITEKIQLRVIHHDERIRVGIITRMGCTKSLGSLAI